MKVGVRVEGWLLETLGVFQSTGQRPQHARKVSVASFTAGTTVTRFAPVASFTRRRRDLRTGRQRGGGGVRVDTGDAFRAKQVWPVEEQTTGKVSTI